MKEAARRGCLFTFSFTLLNFYPTMKLPLILCLLLLSLGACQKDAEDEVQPEYADWYALRAPDDRAIEAVYGDIDGTLLITTGFKIYQTTDRGRTWRTANYQSNHGLFGFVQLQDTLFVLNTQTGSATNNTTTAYAAHPSYFSLDQGMTWKLYNDWRRRSDYVPRVARNRATSASGMEYSIDYLVTPVSSQSSGSYIETVGIKTSTGQLLSLPQEHQVTSVYFDASSRLYVTGSAALCGRGKDFSFCGEQNGMLYVSKKPQP
jgi:hypothetical protein